MLRHQLLLIFRNFKKFRSTFFINLIGLATGLASAILIFLWVSDELTIDQYHEHKQNLYHVKTNHDNEGGIITVFAGPGLLAEAMETEISQVQLAAATSTLIPDVSFTHEEETVAMDGYFVDNNYFQMFRLELLAGDREQLLWDKNNVVLSETTARKFFKNPKDAVGKVMEWKVFDFSNQVKISGVYRDFPDNSTIQSDFLLAFPFFKDMLGDGVHWDNHNAITYVLLDPETDINEFNRTYKNFIQSKLPDSNVTLYAQRFADGYLYSTFENGVPVGGRIGYVRLFSIIALFVLLIACINFMNLTTAKATKRVKEVGIKKAIGAGRKSLAIQFLSESFAMTLLALLLAVMLVLIFLPNFNTITGKNLELIPEPTFILTLLGIGLITAILAGSYPAFYLSGFQPSRVLKGNEKGSFAELIARKGLVVFQFTLSLTMIIAVAVIGRQIDYIQSKNLGFEKENVLQLSSSGLDAGKMNTFLSRLKQVPGVANATSMQNPFVGERSSTIGLEWEGKDPESIIKFENITVNYDFIETLGLSMVEGRSFSDSYGDEASKIILNQKAIDVIGMEDPVGKVVNLWGNDMQVIGVVQDFHFESLREEIKPAFLKHSNEFQQKTLLKIEKGKEQSALAGIEEVYGQFNPGADFEYEFLDDDFQTLYLAEQRISVFSKYAGGFAILISCLGLFGLASFTAEKRRKEIGVRKALGASMASVVTMLTGEFIRLILLAIVLAVPLSWYLCQKWLSGFNYSTTMDWRIFVFSGVLVILIAILTVSSQAIKAALLNPVDSLKSE